jgi:hypothetical protein
MIYKRGKQWHMDATIRGERYRESLCTSDGREALNLEKKRIAEIQQGKAAPAADREFARLLFGEAADAFLRERPGHVSERSVQFEKERLKPLREFFGHKRSGKFGQTTSVRTSGRAWKLGCPAKRSTWTSVS